MTEQICEAIARRRLISLTYGGRERVVEPYIHGRTTAGREVVLCFQREGESATGGGGWRLLHVDQIVDLQMLDVTFPFDAATYDPHADEVRHVHCRVDLS